MKPTALWISALLMCATAPLMAQSQNLVEVVEVVETVMARTVEMPGSVISAQDSNVAAQVNGSVVWIAEEGSLVEAGDSIAEIDPRDWQFDLDNANTQVKRLESRLVVRRGELARLERLLGQNNAAQMAYDNAQASVVEAEQDLAAALTAKSRAQVNLERTVVRAPFAGRVVRRLAQLGEYATAGRDMLRLVDTQRLMVRTQVPVSMANVAREGFRC